MIKKLVIFLFALVVVLVALGVWLGYELNKRSGAGGISEYSAVYLSSGDIYFGKLSWFLKPKLKNVWFLQRSVDSKNQPQFGVAPLTNAFWGPVSEISLNSKEIIFWVRLRKDSEVVKAMQNPQALSTGAPGTQGTGVIQPSGSGDK